MFKDFAHATTIEVNHNCTKEYCGYRRNDINDNVGCVGHNRDAHILLHEKALWTAGHTLAKRNEEASGIAASTNRDIGWTAIAIGYIAHYQMYGEV